MIDPKLELQFNPIKSSIFSRNSFGRIIYLKKRCINSHCVSNMENILETLSISILKTAKSFTFNYY